MARHFDSLLQPLRSTRSPLVLVVTDQTFPVLTRRIEPELLSPPKSAATRAKFGGRFPGTATRAKGPIPTPRFGTVITYYFLSEQRQLKFNLASCE